MLEDALRDLRRLFAHSKLNQLLGKAKQPFTTAGINSASKALTQHVDWLPSFKALSRTI